jgi:hypothetical protein
MLLLPVCAAAPRATAVRTPARHGAAARARLAAPRRASLLNASDPGSFEVCDVSAAFEDCALLTGAAQQARAAPFNSRARERSAHLSSSARRTASRSTAAPRRKTRTLLSGR